MDDQVKACNHLKDENQRNKQNSEKRGESIDNNSSSSSPNTTMTPDGAVVSTSKRRFLAIFISLILAIFCVALDNTIIVTAIPRITDEYQALNDVGWYGSAFILPSAALLPLFGKIYTFVSAKWTFLVALLIFEVGSLISAVASTSTVFIVGRAISGAGSAGIFSGALVIIAMLSPLEKRPAYQSIIGGIFAISTIIAPLIGGAFTDRVTWRWCFYINLPIGGLAALVLFLALKLSSPSTRIDRTLSKLFWSLDPVGTILFIPSIVCILLALQWGGTTYPWQDPRIIALLVVFAILLLAFIATELRQDTNATIPPHIASQRTVASASLFAFLNYGQFFIFVYFIPIYFQAVKGVSAQQSGIDTIPMIISNNIASLISGFLTSRYGHWVHFFYASAVLISVGAGLITTWTVGTSTAMWAGSQVLAGFGVGLALALPQIAVQPVLAAEDIPVGIAMTLFMQFFGGALAVSIGNNVLNTKLVEHVGEIGIPAFDAGTIVRLGATGLRGAVPIEFLPRVLDAYMEALRQVFRAGLVIACLSVLAALPLEWKSVKGPKAGVQGSGEAARAS